MLVCVSLKSQTYNGTRLCAVTTDVPMLLSVSISVAKVGSPIFCKLIKIITGKYEKVCFLRNRHDGYPFPIATVLLQIYCKIIVLPQFQMGGGNPGGTVITNLQSGALVSPLAGLKFSIRALPFRPQSK
jgi:hypothetical protein